MATASTGKRWSLGGLQLFTPDCTVPVQEFLSYEVVNRDAIAPIIQTCLGRTEFRSTVLDLHRALGFKQTPNPGQALDRKITNDILGAFQAGQLYLLRRRTGVGGAGQGDAPAGAEKKKSAAPPPGPVDTKEKTWIEIHLVDQDDQPVANRKYRLKVTDGSVRTGETGSDGTIRVTGIDPGTCEISFYDLDADEWKAAG